ncbi:MAG TPA: hypothetical protein VNW90_10915 [Acetobacteraceae bacterium]|jgi:hypothetical protein|nr:hypothetical protein [Acetobacteraceae bacterium]
MTNRQRITEYLRTIAPKGASNSDICSATRVSPHAQVFQITGQLMSEGIIHGRKLGNEWYFTWSGSDDSGRTAPNTQPDLHRLPMNSGPSYTPADFEQSAAVAMGRYYGTTFAPGLIPGVPKKFDFVSPDRKIVGDAKYYTLVNSIGLPPAKFSIIAEHVWLLERTKADRQFLVFGNERRVPERWLAKYGCLVDACCFFFLMPDGTLQPLHGAKDSCP